MEVIKRLSILIEEWKALLLETIKRWTPLVQDAYRKRIHPSLVTIKGRIPRVRDALMKLLEQADHHILRFLEKRSPHIKDRFMKSGLSPMLFIGMLGIGIVLVGGYASESEVNNSNVTAAAEQSKRDYDKEYEEALARTSYGTAAITTTNTMTFNTLMGQ